MSPSPLVLFSFPYVCSLTSLCDAELGSEASRVAEASQVEAQRLKEKAEASRAEALSWKEKAEACQAETRRWEQKAKGEFRGLPSLTWVVFSLARPHSIFRGAESEAEFARAAEASSVVQTVLDTEIEEHEALKRAALSACEALEVEGV